MHGRALVELGESGVVSPLLLLLWLWHARELHFLVVGLVVAAVVVPTRPVGLGLAVVEAVMSLLLLLHGQVGKGL